MQNETTNELIRRCKGNDRKAQFELYKLYSKAMFNICRRMMRNETEAEDMLQEAFVKAFKSLDSYKSEATFGAWLKRIVINTCITKLGKKKIQFTEMVEGRDFVDNTNDQNTNVAYDVSSIKNAIKSLPDGYRIIFTMYALEGYDHQEIGEVLNISTSTSKSQYSRAKNKLREIISGDDRISMIS